MSCSSIPAERAACLRRRSEMTKRLNGLLAVLLALSVLICLPGCSLFRESREPEPEPPSAEEEAEPAKVPAAGRILITLNLPWEQTALIRDGDYWTDVSFTGGKITVRSKEPIGGLYLIWGSYPGEWTLETDSGSVQCGLNGFLHEYIPLDGSSERLSILLPEQETRLCDLFCYGVGQVPDDVQQWLPPCEEADLLVFSTHADDELVFFGGMIPYCSAVCGRKVQLVYMTTNYYAEDYNRVRIHEALNALWTAGARYYPVTNMQEDRLFRTLEEAEEFYGKEWFRTFQVEQIRRFRPLVIVAQDPEGEYGHGAHQLTARTLQWAVYAAADRSQYPELAERYGVWNTPKTYLHLFGPEEERTVLDYETPSELLGGKNPFEIACLAYEKHETQQQWEFEVYSFDSEYDSHSFGLYRSLVGPDEMKNDLFEHLETLVYRTGQPGE